MRTRILWLVATLALASCHKDDTHANAAPPGGGSGSGSGSGSAAAPAPIPGRVDLFVDDKPVGAVMPKQVALWPRVDTLVPVAARRLGKWEDVYLKGKTPKPSELHRPSATYPELVPALFPGPDGTTSFGMFDPVELAKHGEPQLREDGIHEVRIRLDQSSGRGQHENGAGGGSDPMDLKITVTTPKGEHVIEGKQLLDIKREPMPGQTGSGRGWPLTTVLEAGGVKQFKRLMLTDAAGMNLTLEKRDFTATSIPFVKLNRQGQLRFRVFKKQGTGWQSNGDLRGLTTIQVLE